MTQHWASQRPSAILNVHMLRALFFILVCKLGCQRWLSMPSPPPSEEILGGLRKWHCAPDSKMPAVPLPLGIHTIV